MTSRREIRVDVLWDYGGIDVIHPEVLPLEMAWYHWIALVAQTLAKREGVSVRIRATASIFP